LKAFAIEALNDIMDETMELAANSSGDGKRFQQEIKALSEQMVVMIHTVSTVGLSSIRTPAFSTHKQIS